MATNMRTLLTNSIEQQVQPYGDDIAIAFSGGTDSMCMLLSSLDLGLNPTLYTYYADKESKDLQVARTVADKLNLPLIEAQIPTDLNMLINDVKRLLQYGCQGQADLQSTHGHLYIAPKVTQPVILFGDGVDKLYGVYRSFAFNGSKKNNEQFNRARHAMLRKDKEGNTTQYARKVYADHGVVLVSPYRCDAIKQYLMNCSWRRINKPRFKHITVQYYPEIDNMDLYRRRGSAQIVGGVRKLHCNLLDTPLNIKGRKRPLELYNDLRDQLQKYGTLQLQTTLQEAHNGA